MFLLRWFLKITNIIPALLLFFPKRYFLGKKYKEPFWRKGPLIISANHRAFIDYIMIATMFPFRKINVIVSEALYDFNPFLRIILKALGAIRTDRFSSNPDFIFKSIRILKNGGVVLVFPEGRIETSDEIYDYKKSLGLIAMESNAPILPIYHRGGFGVFKNRNKAFIGDLIYAGDYVEEDKKLSENAISVTEAVRNKTVEYHDFYRNSMYSNKVKKPKKSHVTFLYRFLMATSSPMIKIFLRPKVVFESDMSKAMLYNEKRMITISNHSWWIDAPMLYYVFRRTSPRCIAAEDIMAKNKFLHNMQKAIGCIFLDRTGFDWNCIKKCLGELNGDGNLIIFPEGQMNFTQKSLPFHSGTAMMSIMTSSPVVPVYINSSYKLFKKTYIYIGNPIKPEALGNTKNSTEEMTRLLESKMDVLRDNCNSITSSKDLAEIASVKEKHKIVIEQNKQRGTKNDK